jgi:hypothetical protein
MKYLKEIIKTAVKKYLNEEQILNEYITNNEIYLRDYLSMSKERKMVYLPHEYYYFFQDFIDETGAEFEQPKETVKSDYEDEDDVEVNMFDDNELELMTWLENNDKKTYNDFAKYLYDRIMDSTLPINDSEYPAWAYFSDNPELIKNQWLIHFTDNANDIAKEGFKYGIDEMEKLGLTCHLSDFEKKYGGYNFAYTLSDFPKYAKKSGGYKYGKEAVIFNASGIKVWHYGDEEPQVIFYGNTAKNIIPITSGENSEFAIYSKDNKILYENDDLKNVVYWLIKNFNQYRKNF